MNQLATLFHSAARTKVLETLFAQELPIHLRLIGSLARCPIRSVELAVRQLHEEGLVTRKATKRMISYSLNRDHTLYPLLTQVLSAATAYKIQERSKKIARRAEEFLPFVSDATRMIEKAKATS